MENMSLPYVVTNFGIVGDGVTNNTEKIAELIKTAEKNGGGTIYFPPGQYVSGTIELKSNMTLYLDSGAVILGSERREDYPMITEDELPGYARGGHSGLIKALRAENIAITGRGVIDGRGYHWWQERKNEHRPRAIQPILCSNVRICGITIKNSAMWTVHPMCCNNVTIDGITIKNPADSPNTDGINPESCANVHISNCTVDVGDDCVTIKSGTEDDLFQKQYPCENIVVTNCTMLNGHGGVVIGSEMSGGIRNITISNCVFCGTDRGIRVKTRRKRGGYIEDVLINNVLMDGVLAAITFNGYYQCGGTDPDDSSLFSLEPLPAADHTPVMKHIVISNVRAKNVEAAAIYMLGIPESPIEGLRLNNFAAQLRPGLGEPKDKPIMAYHVKKTNGLGIYCENIKDAVFRDVSLHAATGAGVTLVNSARVSMKGLDITGVEQQYDIINCTDINVDDKNIEG